MKKLTSILIFGALLLAILLIPPLAILALISLSVFLTYQIYLKIYFNSYRFKKIKDSIQKHTQSCNELNHHIQELKYSYVNIKSRAYGASHLYDNSHFNFKRREWNNEIKNNYFHNCSLSVCKSASDQPFKYLCKYFYIKISEETLVDFESTLNNFAAAEQGKILLKTERDSILANTRNLIPGIIYRFSKSKLTKKLGFENIDLSDLYFPVYTFQYVSGGGNSSSRCDIKLNIENLDKLIQYLNQLVKVRQSVEGQRALLTSSLREKIKNRDNYTCKRCNLSTHNIQNLLLEIDHIIPLSKGGITSLDNLQTLCWKCNRSKGARIEN